MNKVKSRKREDSGERLPAARVAKGWPYWFLHPKFMLSCVYPVFSFSLMGGSNRNFLRVGPLPIYSLTLIDFQVETSQFMTHAYFYVFLTFRKTPTATEIEITDFLKKCSHR